MAYKYGSGECLRKKRDPFTIGPITRGWPGDYQRWTVMASYDERQLFLESLFRSGVRAVLR